MTSLFRMSVMDFTFTLTYQKWQQHFTTKRTPNCYENTILTVIFSKSKCCAFPWLLISAHSSLTLSCVFVNWADVNPQSSSAFL